MAIAWAKGNRHSATAAMAYRMAAVLGAGISIIVSCVPATRSYRVIDIDYMTFRPDIVVSVESPQGECYFVLSRMDRGQRQSECMAGYEELQKNAIHRLTLVKYGQKPIIGIASHVDEYMFYPYGKDSIANRAVFEWANGMIHNDVYHCREIHGICVRVKHR